MKKENRCQMSKSKNFLRKTFSFDLQVLKLVFLRLVNWVLNNKWNFFWKMNCKIDENIFTEVMMSFRLQFLRQSRHRTKKHFQKKKKEVCFFLIRHQKMFLFRRLCRLDKHLKIRYLKKTFEEVAWFMLLCLSFLKFHFFDAVKKTLTMALQR